MVVGDDLLFLIALQNSYLPWCSHSACSLLASERAAVAIALCWGIVWCSQVNCRLLYSDFISLHAESIPNWAQRQIYSLTDRMSCNAPDSWDQRRRADSSERLWSSAPITYSICSWCSVMFPIIKSDPDMCFSVSISLDLMIIIFDFYTTFDTRRSWTRMENCL